MEAYFIQPSYPMSQSPGPQYLSEYQPALTHSSPPAQTAPVSSDPLMSTCSDTTPASYDPCPATVPAPSDLLISTCYATVPASIFPVKPVSNLFKYFQPSWASSALPALHCTTYAFRSFSTAAHSPGFGPATEQGISKMHHGQRKLSWNPAPPHHSEYLCLSVVSTEESQASISKTWVPHHVQAHLQTRTSLSVSHYLNMVNLVWQLDQETQHGSHVRHVE